MASKNKQTRSYTSKEIENSKSQEISKILDTNRHPYIPNHVTLSFIHPTAPFYLSVSITFWDFHLSILLLFVTNSIHMYKYKYDFIHVNIYKTNKLGTFPGYPGSRSIHKGLSKGYQDGPKSKVVFCLQQIISIIIAVLQRN